MTDARAASTDNWHERVFFGLHYDLHATAGDTELGAAVTPELLRAAWEAIGPDWIQCDCKGHPGYTSWPTKTGYASPGIVRDALRIHRDVTRDMGLPLVMHYSGIWDEAAIHHHPDWARVNPSGRREPGRACPRSAYLTELLVPQMLELIDDYDVDGFWVDGDIWATAPCYCPRCRTAFAAETGIVDPPQRPGQPGWQWWLAFQRRSYEAYVRAYVDAVHARKPECLVCINWLYSVRHPDPVSIPVDFLSGDFSHAWGLQRAIAEARFLDSRGLPWDLMAWGFTTGEDIHGGWQFKTAAHLCQEVSEVVANGGAVCVYVHPPRDGHLVRWHHEVLADIARFCRARQEITLDSASVPQAVVLHSQSHFYAHNDPLYGMAQATYPMEGALHALLDTGYHVELQNEDGLMARLHDYRLVVVPEQEPLPDRVVEALAGYVERGGRLVLSGAHLARHAAMAQLAGVEPDGDWREGFHYLPVVTEDGGQAPDDRTSFTGGENSALGGRRFAVTQAVTVAGPWQPVRPRVGTETTAWAALLRGPEPERDDTGAAAITVRAAGAGRVAAAHGPLFRAYYRAHYPQLRRLLSRLFCEVWPDPMVEVDLESPGHVVHTVRRQAARGAQAGERGRLARTLVHLLNRSMAPATSPRNVMVEHVPPVGPVTMRLRLGQQPAAVRLVGEGGGPLDWRWANGVLTVQVPRLDIHTAVVVEEANET